MARLQFWVCALAIIGAAAAASACRPGITQTQRTLLQLDSPNFYCGELKSQGGTCAHVTTTLKRAVNCDVGGLPNTKMVYSPLKPLDKRFSPADFDKSCLVNAGVDCAHEANGDILGGSTDHTKACCSCYLYKKYCAGAGGTYVYDEPLTSTTTVHSLLMPVSPCTGIENYNRPGCPNEQIWDKGQADLNSSGKDKLHWGMAINPTTRRGQHQMHIHLAEVQPTLIDNINYGHGTEKRNEFDLDCGLSKTKRTIDKCTVLKKGTQTSNFNPHVVITPKITTPSQFEPFRRVYSDNPKSSVSNVLYASTLVIRVPGTTDQWAVITNEAGPAECFFKNNGGGACKNG